MDRRAFAKLTGGAALLRIGGAVGRCRPTLAQDSTSLADLGLPELTVTLTDDGFAVSPSETAAGWTLVTLENLTTEDDSGPDFTLIPAGETMDAIVGSVGTPTAGIPAWVFETTWAGGPFVPQGETAVGVVNLTEGDWMVWSGGEAFGAAALTVTAGAAATPAPPAITADVEVELQEFAFVEFDDVVPAGPRVWQVANTGEQPHVTILFSVPDGTTTEQLLTGLTAMMTGAPAEDGVDPESLRSVGGCTTLSAGQTAWIELDLAAGSYGAVCFSPDEETGAPHVLMGMATVFAVE